MGSFCPGMSRPYLHSHSNFTEPLAETAPPPTGERMEGDPAVSDITFAVVSVVDLRDAGDDVPPTMRERAVVKVCGVCSSRCAARAATAPRTGCRSISSG